MAQEVKIHDETLMPITMGAPYRVPYHAYPNWGLEYADETSANLAYKAEWALGTGEQMRLVTEATKGAFDQDYPQILRQKTAEVVGAYLRDNPRAAALIKFNDSLNIVDVGSGPGLSAFEVYRAIPKEFRPDTRFTLVDPSKQALTEAKTRLESNRVRSSAIEGTDSSVLRSLIPPFSTDIIVAVASVHHHAKISFNRYFSALREGGLLVIADWHQPIWEHPGSVLQFLERFDWPNKDAGLNHWVETYPQAENPPASLDNPNERQAIEQITKFWLAYEDIVRAKNIGSNAIWPLEGHRSVGRYVEALKKVHFSLDTPDIRRIISSNPFQILENSSLLQVTVAQKALI